MLLLFSRLTLPAFFPFISFNRERFWFKTLPQTPLKECWTDCWSIDARIESKKKMFFERKTRNKLNERISYLITNVWSVWCSVYLLHTFIHNLFSWFLIFWACDVCLMLLNFLNSIQENTMYVHNCCFFYSLFNSFLQFASAFRWNCANDDVFRQSGWQLHVKWMFFHLFLQFFFNYNYNNRYRD